MTYRTYRVSPPARQPLLDFMTGSLESAGCRILRAGPSSEAPFLITVEAPDGERLGILAYAFRATRTPTKHRPEDERSFQIKYGAKKDNDFHDIFQDPTGLLTTVVIGIDPDDGFFVGVDPILRNPTRLFIRVEFKDHHADSIRADGWCTWQREHKASDDGPEIEVLVGGRGDRFLDYVRFERTAVGLDQGHRQLLAEKWATTSAVDHHGLVAGDSAQRSIHVLEEEFGLTSREVLDLIASAPRLKMAVRGWVAEEHLVAILAGLDGVTDCNRIEVDGKPDVLLRFRGHNVSVECKNVLRARSAAGLPRLDFQRTRAAKADPCSRYYRANEFDLIAACLHPLTESWEFKFQLPAVLTAHSTCEGRLASAQHVTSAWQEADQALRRVIS